MRISLDRDDPRFLPSALAARVYLDGELQDHVITADDERGEVIRFLIGIDGKPVRNPANRELMRETLRGSVRIEWPKPR
jgi:hypothetical protein